MKKNFIRRIYSNPPVLAMWIGGAIALWVLSGLVFPSIDMDEHSVAEEKTAQVARKTQIAVQKRVAQVKRRDIILNGVTEPDRTTLIEAQTESEVHSIQVKEGQVVAKGAKLVQLDVRDRLDRLREARALVDQRRIEYNAATKLKAKGFQSTVGLARTRTDLEVAKRALKQVRLDLAYTTITAPYDGLVEEVLIEEGDIVGRGFNKQAVIRFVDLSPIRVVGQVPENEVLLLKKGDKAYIKLANGAQYEGVIRFIAKVAENEARSFKVEAEVSNEKGLIPAGVSAEMTLSGDQQMAYLVSASVLALNDNGTVGVKLIDENGVVHFRPVEVVSQSENGVWISGLPSKIYLVTAGVNFISHGQSVDLPALLVASSARVPLSGRDGEILSESND